MSIVGVLSKKSELKMQLFIYKLYYVIFLYYSKHKGEVPWISAQAVLTVFFGCLTIGIFEIFRLLSPLDIFSYLPNTSGHLNKYISTFLFAFFIWKGLSYVLYKKLQISKVDGKSPLYEFSPTKKDNILTIIYVTTSVFSIMIIKGGYNGSYSASYFGLVVPVISVQMVPL